MATIMNVRGIPSLEPVTADNRIKENTTPLAPSNMLFGSMIICTIPVIRATTKITISSRWLPYFSSSIGPTSKNNSILFI